MTSEEQQTPSRWRRRFWSKSTATERVRQGDGNTDNLVVLTISLAALAAIAVGLACMLAADRPGYPRDQRFWRLRSSTDALAVINKRRSAIVLRDFALELSSFATIRTA